MRPRHAFQRRPLCHSPRSGIVVFKSRQESSPRRASPSVSLTSLGACRLQESSRVVRVVSSSGVALCVTHLARGLFVFKSRQESSRIVRVVSSSGVTFCFNVISREARMPCRRDRRQESSRVVKSRQESSPRRASPSVSLDLAPCVLGMLFTIQTLIHLHPCLTESKNATTYPPGAHSILTGLLTT